jgi:uncharacterized protein (DUF433 family)
MTVSLHSDPLPLRLDETGTIRVGASRVTLDVVLADYRSGMSPEEIVRQLDTLSLADVHATIAYCLRHQDEVDAYLKRRRADADEVQSRIEAAQSDRSLLRSKLMKRLEPNVPDAE